MFIGINATPAFKQPRTGVEEYTYQLVKHLAMLEQGKKHRFLLYQDSRVNSKGFSLTDNFKIKQLAWSWPMWTQIRLASEMALNKPDVLFIPVHILPLIRPKNSVVTIHGLEYEYYPKMYPWKHLRYLRWITKYALKNANKVIAVSETTKRDLIDLYGGNPEKISVIHHGVENKFSIFNNQFSLNSQFSISKPFILYIGRIELKKNIDGILEAYKILKKKHKVPHKLILAGLPGFGYDVLKLKIRNLLKIKNLKLEIIELGYVSEQEKSELLNNADMFVLPSFYEGFGMPILEAQAVSCPVITSNVSSMPEVAGHGAILVEPRNIEQIAESMYKVISDNDLRKDLIEKGNQNLKKFSWQKCAEETLRVILG